MWLTDDADCHHHVHTPAARGHMSPMIKKIESCIWTHQSPTSLTALIHGHLAKCDC